MQTTSNTDLFRVSSATPSVAVIGAGIAGTSCAVALQRAGLNVTVFDKSRGLGGRMATRRIAWRDVMGAEQTTELDHGAQHFGTQSPRFAAVIERAVAAGAVQPWQPRVHAPWPAATDVRSFVATPNMTALCRHLLRGIDVRCERQVQRLRRDGSGWRLVIADSSDAGPFDHVVLAMPPAQAAALLVGHHDEWSQSLAGLQMDACWTLMAITDDVDWPWDAAVPERGALAWITRNDRKPGRASPRGVACWVAHATPQWTAPRLEVTDPRNIVDELQQALQAAVSPNQALAWRHCSVHRWRYAAVTHPTADGAASWWDRDLGLGVCGDFLGGGDVEAAWRSGDELADTLAASTEDIAAGAGTPTATSWPQAVS